MCDNFGCIVHLICMRCKTNLLSFCFLITLFVRVDAVDFQIKEHLGHTWSNELVRFPIDSNQEKKITQGFGLQDDQGNSTPFQIVEDNGGKGEVVGCFGQVAE